MTELAGALARAKLYDLEHPRYAGAPVWPAHEPGVLLKLHRRHEPGLGEARTSASALLVMAEHSGTHIDAFCHQAENLCMHGGVEVNAQVQTPEGFTELGTDTIPPLFARGVLLDCADAGHAVGADDLERAAEGLEIRPGDVILVRTGTGALWEDPEALKQRTATTPLRRIGEPDEIAGAAVYLASPASAFMTGQSIVIDGGVTI